MPAAKKKGGKGDEDTPTILNGVYMFPNGDKYDGDYRQTEGGLQRCGPGTHTSHDGVVYTGNWQDDCMNGQGKLDHPAGAVYEGDFVNNQFHGRGQYTWSNGSFYIGQFVENRMEGDGEFTDTDGQVWTGTFRYKAAPGLQFKLNL